MKNITPTLPTSPATAPQNRETSTSPLAPSPLPSETLLALGAIFAGQQVAGMLGDLDEANKAFGVQAGIVATLHRILPPEQFRAVMIQWEVDTIKLTEIFELTSKQ